MSSLNVCEDLMRQSTNNNNEICCVFIKDNKDEAIIVCLSTIPIRLENIDKMIKLSKEQGISTIHIPHEYFQVKEIIKLPTGEINYREMIKIAKQAFIDTNE